MMKKILLCLLTVLAFAAPVQGTTYYVRKVGNDNASGTSWTTAWVSIDKVNSSLSGGDTVYFGTGTWRGQILPPAGASAGDRTCYACSSFVQGICKIYPSANLTGWIQHSGNVYKTRWTDQGGQWDCGTVYCLAQNDSMLHYVSSLSGVNGAGKYFHNTSTDTIYAWCYGGGDPDDYTMEGSNRSAVVINSRDYITFWGLTVRYSGCGGAITLTGDPEPNYIYIDHCNISRCSGLPAENPAAVLFLNEAGSDTNGFGHGNRVRTCQIGYVLDHSGSPGHGTGVTVYSEHSLVVESCYVFAPFSGAGLEKKETDDGSYCRNTIFRYNTIVGAPTGVIAGWNHPYNDSVYGNVFIDCSTAIAVEGSASPAGSGVFLGNNTIYNSEYTALGGWITGDYLSTPNKQFKYNIYYRMGDIEYIAFLRAMDLSSWSIDSNFYYVSDTVFNVEWSPITLSQWQNTYGFDVRSTFGVNPGFTDPASGDFSRPSSSQEMNLTYGGKTWTRYGAWQPDNGGENHCPTSPTLNSPSDKDTVFCTRPTLNLNDSSDPDPQDALVYDFQVYSDSQLVNLVANATNVTQGQSITSWQVNPELPDESWYWWRARSFDGTCYSNWSEKSKFYVEARQISYGDLNHDGTIDVSDVIYVIGYLYRGGPAPQPIQSGDVNADYLIDIADVVYLINYLFKSGPPPMPGCSNQGNDLAPICS